MLNNLRNSLQPHLEKLGNSFASTGISPTGWSVIGLVFAFASAFFYGWNIEFSLIIGGIVLLVAGFFDIVDGQVARATKKITKTGGFLDSVFDKIAEVAIFFGILVGGFAEPYLVFLAISLSLLVSYTRSRAESLGVKLQGIGIGERAERLLVIAIVGIIGFMEYAVIIVIIIAGITFVQRIIITVKELNKN
uniref:Archaetidylinositol phosphate synthase n=1 Tax=uncultured marine thaumarchaeote KM3_11_E10 TaxID=1455991 RepID=A0A075G703_9ARCH|nr:CDP-alcohol phosphatidyltransferase (pgsA, PGS1) [uncultured marine thaumarchaeote KM3_11_E10]|tara:strand:+ start:101 stop:676 length:576 start_codon:yes stop_codon:yes gene_type:complete